VEERLALATEMIRLAEESGDREREHQGHHWRMLALMELGDIPAADVEIASQARLAEELRQPAQRWYTGVVRAMRTLFEGNFEEGERLAEEALILGEARYPARLVILGAQRFVSRWQLGRLHELEAAVKRYLERYPAAHFARANVALLYRELGAETDARREFERAATNDFADLPRDNLWLWLTTNFSEVCAFLGDSPRAQALYEMLLPYADRNVVSAGYVCCGSVSRCLGLLAVVMRRLEDAVRHFENAVSMNTRMGAPPWVARTQCDFAAMLVARGAPGDRERAAVLLTEARDTARTLGMRSLLDEADTLERRLGAAPADAQTGHIFRRQGDFWTIAYQGRSFSVRDMKGLQYISRLLEDPGRQIHCMELLADDKGPSADDRRRLQELQADLDEAETRHDLGQATRLRAERDDLLAKLAGETGLGEHDTEAARARERARINVARTIKDAIARIREHDAALARHLALAVHTGAWCSYAPETEVRWTL